MFFAVDFDTNALRKKVNEVQKDIAAKKKVCSPSNALGFIKPMPIGKRISRRSGSYKKGDRRAG